MRASCEAWGRSLSGLGANDTIVPDTVVPLAYARLSMYVCNRLRVLPYTYHTYAGPLIRARALALAPNRRQLLPRLPTRQ